METRASYLLVGSFVLAIMAGAVVFVIWVTGTSAEKTVRYHMRFAGSVPGLQVGSQVRFRGIPVGEVKAMLVSHEAIDTAQTLMVNFVSFGPSSVDFFLYTFTKTIVWTEFHEIKQDVLLRIAKIIEDHGAEIAFPTQTLHINPEPALE